MEPNKFLLLAITCLWLAGLYGVLFMVNALAQQQRRSGRRQPEEGVAPRLLTPLYLSLGLFCAGLALRTYLLAPALPATLFLSLPLSAAIGQRSVAAGWTLLALLLVMQAFITAMAGVRFGWDEAALRGRDYDWDESAPGTPSALVQWLAVLSLFWIVFFTFGQMQLQVWEMVMRLLVSWLVS